MAELDYPLSHRLELGDICNVAAGDPADRANSLAPPRFAGNISLGDHYLSDHQPVANIIAAGPIRSNYVTGNTHRGVNTSCTTYEDCLCDTFHHSSIHPLMGCSRKPDQFNTDINNNYTHLDFWKYNGGCTFVLPEDIECTDANCLQNDRLVCKNDPPDTFPLGTDKDYYLFPSADNNWIPPKPPWVTDSAWDDTSASYVGATRGGGAGNLRVNKKI